MNFNKISKKYIVKEEINACVVDGELNWKELGTYMYKIASIVSTKFYFGGEDDRENSIQDAVCTSFYRHKSFNPAKNTCVYSYFYKLILNHYRDILRKKQRRGGIAQMVSYEVATEDNIDFSDNYSYTIERDVASIDDITGKKFNYKMVLDEKKQSYFLDFSAVNIRYQAFREVKKRVKKNNSAVQNCFIKL